MKFYCLFFSLYFAIYLLFLANRTVTGQFLGLCELFDLILESCLHSHSLIKTSGKLSLKLCLG